MPSRLKRTTSGIDEEQQCLSRARQDWKPCLIQDYHRTESGELRRRLSRESCEGNEEESGHQDKGNSTLLKHKSAPIGSISPPMKISARTTINLGKSITSWRFCMDLDDFEVVPEKLLLVGLTMTMKTDRPMMPFRCSFISRMLLPTCPCWVG